MKLRNEQAVANTDGKEIYRRGEFRASVFHFIEHPIDGICCVGPRPVCATRAIAK
jgi:hypothetical protein